MFEKKRCIYSFLLSSYYPGYPNIISKYFVLTSFCCFWFWGLVCMSIYNVFKGSVNLSFSSTVSNGQRCINQGLFLHLISHQFLLILSKVMLGALE